MISIISAKCVVLVKVQHRISLKCPRRCACAKQSCQSHCQSKIVLMPFCAESVVYVEVKHWKSLSKKMSTLGWSFAPIEMFINASSEQPTSRQAPCYYLFQIYTNLYQGTDVFAPIPAYSALLIAHACLLLDIL